ncbi:MAG TPA: glycosyltransferase [Spirochaetia bacterium]|nr:glycosyltransferase [Spirochaetia bacterium]
MDLSIVLPVYNEKDNLRLLYGKLNAVLSKYPKEYEVIFVNDGSKDGSELVLNELAKEDPKIKVIHFRKNFGQTPAMAAGIDYSKGEIIVLMDSDLQNDPEDIPRLLQKIDEGYDVVSGWRKKRKDTLFMRKIPSWIANKLIRKISGVEIKDLGCSLKAYKRDILKNVKLYGEMHRFISIHASWVGAKIANIEVQHHPRQFGQSKYGISRTFKVLVDMFAMKFTRSYSTKPMYFFGKIAFLNFFIGLASFGLYLYRAFKSNQFLTDPALLLVFLFWALGMLFIGFGLLSEIMVRVYHESQDKPIYHVKETVNL